MYSKPANSNPILVYPNVYISISKLITSSTRRTDEIITSIPDNKLLIESDTHDAANCDRLMNEVFELVCGVKNWTPQVATDILSENWTRFTN